MSGELRLVFENRMSGKWEPLGSDGNEFDRSSDGRAEAWREAQAAANLGTPWAGATFRLVDPFEGEHRDDCALGLDGSAWCDCGVELAIVEERVVMPEWKPMDARSAYPVEVEIVRDRVLSREDSASYGLGERVREVTLKTRQMSKKETDRLGLGPLVIEARFVPEDDKAREELSRLSKQKLDEIWSGRPAQKQVLSNTLYGRSYSKEQKARIVEKMAGRPLVDLGLVVAEVLG